MGLVETLVAVLGGILGAILLGWRSYRAGENRERDRRAKDDLDAERETRKRLNNAIQSGDAVDLSPDGLRDDDGYRRD